MDYYICQTAKGPQLAGTQADAKALDRNFKPYAVDTAKAPLMAHLNALLKQAYQGAELTAPAIPSMDVLLADMDEATKADLLKRLGGAAAKGVKVLPADYRGHPTDCPSCFRTPKGALHFAKAADKDEIEDQIAHIDETWQLDRLAEAIEGRRREIAKPVVQPVAPRSRVRPATV